MVGAAPADPEATAADSDPAESEGPRVHIEVQGRREVEVVLRAHALDLRPRRWGTAVWESDEQVCRAPCDAVVDVSQSPSFYVTGPGLARSSAFTLPPAGAVQLRVRPRRRALIHLAWVMAVVGGLAVFGGATTMVVGGDDRRTLTAGGITLGAGLPLAIAGVVMLRQVRTRVEVVPQQR